MIDLILLLCCASVEMMYVEIPGTAHVPPSTEGNILSITRNPKMMKTSQAGNQYTVEGVNRYIQRNV